MCDECARLRAVYAGVSEQLSAAQRKLAQYQRANTEFGRVWKECESALKRSWKLRDEIAAHAATHEDDAIKAHGAT